MCMQHMDCIECEIIYRPCHVCSDNKIGPDGAAAMAASLGLLTCLQELYLRCSLACSRSLDLFLSLCPFPLLFLLTPSPSPTKPP